MAAHRPDTTLQALGNRCLDRLAGKLTGQVTGSGGASDGLGVLIRECTSLNVATLSADHLFDAVKLLSNLTLQEGTMALLMQAGGTCALACLAVLMARSSLNVVLCAVCCGCVCSA
jgi:hypothetical protein